MKLYNVFSSADFKSHRLPVINLKNQIWTRQPFSSISTLGICLGASFSEWCRFSGEAKKHCSILIRWKKNISQTFSPRPVLRLFDLPRFPLQILV